MIRTSGYIRGPVLCFSSSLCWRQRFLLLGCGTATSSLILQKLVNVELYGRRGRLHIVDLDSIPIHQMLSWRHDRVPIVAVNSCRFSWCCVVRSHDRRRGENVAYWRSESVLLIAVGILKQHEYMSCATCHRLCVPVALPTKQSVSA